MKDLIARLRVGTGGGKHWMDLHEEAADEIERLTAERDAATAAERERISDNVWDAVMDDCENGVKWLNETASEKLMMNYPALWAALGAIRKGPTP